MSNTGTRNETKYRAIRSKDGKYSPKLDRATSDRFIRYCEMMNVNKSTTVAEAVNYYLDTVERRTLEEKSKEELIEMLLRR